MTSAFIKAADLHALKPGNMLRVRLQNQNILLANIDGEIYAIDDQCSHEDASLYNGAIKDHCVECPLHGSRFSFKTGKPMEPPATEAVRTYEVKTENNEILIAL